MPKNDLRCIYQGKPIKTITMKDNQLIQGFAQYDDQHHKALLMIHGFSSTPAVFRHMFPKLTQYNAIIAPTLPGHGDSIDRFAQVKSTEWQTYIEAIFEQLSSEYKKVDVLGLSLGGILAGYLSQKFTLNHLYLLAPAFDLKQSIPFTLSLATLMKKLGFCNLRAKAGNIHKQQDCEIAYRQIPLATIIEVLNLIQKYPWITPTCPTDVFLGMHDDVVDSKKIAARFNSAPNAKIHWLKNSAHVLPLDGDVDVIVKYLNL